MYCHYNPQLACVQVAYYFRMNSTTIQSVRSEIGVLRWKTYCFDRDSANRNDNIFDAYSCDIICLLLSCSFLSRLLTGVLAHHVGWIHSSCGMARSATEHVSSERSHTVSYLSVLSGLICCLSYCLPYHMR